MRGKKSVKSIESFPSRSMFIAGIVTQHCVRGSVPKARIERGWEDEGENIFLSTHTPAVS